MLSRISSRLIEHHPQDAAGVLEGAAPEVVAEVLAALPAPVSAALIRTLSPHSAVAGLTRLAPGMAAQAVAHLSIERAAALLLRLDTVTRRALLDALPGRVSMPLRLMMRFPAGSVGSLIDPRVVTVRSDSRIGEATEMARRAPELLRKYLYVLDEAQRLIGVVDARQCVVRSPHSPIAELQTKSPVALRARASLREARLNPAWERFSVLPAVDHRGIFLGVVRRMSFFRAIAVEDNQAPTESFANLALALAELYWQASTGLLAGTLQEDRPR